jgi:hypothetical protein
MLVKITSLFQQPYHKVKEICDPNFEKVYLLFQEKIHPKVQKLHQKGQFIYKKYIKPRCTILLKSVQEIIKDEEGKLRGKLFGEGGWLRGLPFSVVSSVAIGYLLGRVNLKTAALYGTIHYLATTALDNLTIDLAKKDPESLTKPNEIDPTAGYLQTGLVCLVSLATSHYVVTQVFKRALKPEITVIFSIASHLFGQFFRFYPNNSSSSYSG